VVPGCRTESIVRVHVRRHSGDHPHNRVLVEITHRQAAVGVICPKISCRFVLVAALRAAVRIFTYCPETENKHEQVYQAYQQPSPAVCRSPGWMVSDIGRASKAVDGHLK